MIPCTVKVRTVGGIVEKPRRFLLWCNVEASNVEASNNSGRNKSSSSAAAIWWEKLHANANDRSPHVVLVESYNWGSSVLI